MAWKACAFSLKRWDLGPGFYCSTCHHNPDNDRWRDIKNGCPTCPLMEAFHQIRVENATKLIEKQGGFPAGFSIDSLTNLHSIVSSIYYGNKGRIDDRWSVTFAELCRIIEQEQAQFKFEQNWISWKKMQVKK